MLWRRALLAGASVLLVGLAFLSGYAAYPLLHRQPGGGALEAAPADLSTFWQVWQLLDQDFLGAPPAARERTFGAIAGMVESFNDPYTFFVEPQTRELERDDLAGQFGGVGATIEQTPAGFMLHPLAEQPAALAGVLDADMLLLVDDQEISTSMTVDAVVALVRGPVGSQVTLVVRRGPEASATEHTFQITRAEIQTPSVEWRLLTDDPQTADVGYLRQTLFSERSSEELRRADELAADGATRYIWDLRGNPGGLLTSAVEEVDMWLESGTILIEEEAGGMRKTFAATAGALVGDAPLVLLVDGGSASASEIVAGALRDKTVPSSWARKPLAKAAYN